MGKDETLCFPTGFTVNSGVISQLVDRNDYIICDDRDHASIVDGRRLSFATQLKFKHNDMEDLEKQLQKCEPNRVKLIIVDGVFSMEGDLCNLPAIIELKKKYNATVMVDEAHGLGVFGRQGRGVCDHFGLTKEVDLIMGTFSKSLASIGGFIAADSSIINWLRHTCRTYIFSASCTPAATAAAREALRIIQAEPERLEALWNVTKYALKRFREEDTDQLPLLEMFGSEEEFAFAKDLLQWSIEQTEENKQLIAKSLQNWEADRIAYMDQIILMVALTEIRRCNEIALEISMNEYIEIAKEYSSDKSYVFINGVLNRVVNDLKAENQLFKLIKK